MSSAHRSPVPNRRGALLDWLGSPTRGKVAGAVLLTTALYVWRSGDGIAHPQLWAEDGRVFFDEARTFGPSSLVTPYAGYLHTVQRLVALAASPFSATLAPQLYMAATVAIVACVAFIVATAEDRHAWLLAGSLMLVPVGGEIFGNLTNVQWFGQVGLLAIAATRPPRNGGLRWAQVVYAAAFAFDGPFSIFAAPLAAWRIWTDRRDAQAWAIGAIIVSGAIVQFGLAVQEGSPYEGQRDSRHLAQAVLGRWLGASAHVGVASRGGTVAIEALFVAALIAASLTAGPLARKSLLYAGIALAATVVRFIPDNGYFDASETGERYFYAPRLALVWCFLLCAIRLRWVSVFGLAGLVLVALGITHWVRGPLPILPWRDGALRIDRGEAVDILINPSRPGGGEADPWMVSVPARRP